MNSAMKKKAVLLLAAAFIAGLFVMMMTVVSYGDGVADDFDEEQWNSKNSSSSSSSSKESGDGYYVRVAAPDGGVNFRSGPGVSYDKLQSDMISNGTKLRIEKVDEDDLGRNWGYTEYSGKHGWIYLPQTKKLEESESSSDKSTSSPDSTPADYYVEVTAPDGGVNFRSGPGVSYDKLQTKLISNGTVLHISRIVQVTNGKNWGYTEYNSVKGWIYLEQTVITT